MEPKHKRQPRSGLAFFVCAWCSDAYTLRHFCTQMTTTGLLLRTVSRKNVRNRRPAARLWEHFAPFSFPAASSSTAEGTFWGVYVASRVLNSVSFSQAAGQSRAHRQERRRRRKKKCKTGGFALFSSRNAKRGLADEPISPPASSSPCGAWGRGEGWRDSRGRGRRCR